MSPDRSGAMPRRESPRANIVVHSARARGESAMIAMLILAAWWRRRCKVARETVKPRMGE